MCSCRKHTQQSIKLRTSNLKGALSAVPQSHKRPFVYSLATLLESNFTPFPLTSNLQALLPSLYQPDLASYFPVKISAFRRQLLQVPALTFLPLSVFMYLLCLPCSSLEGQLVRPRPDHLLVH